MSAGLKQEAHGQWQKIGPETWQIGRWHVYRSLLPQPVYWVSKGRGKPERIESRDEVIARVSQ